MIFKVFVRMVLAGCLLGCYWFPGAYALNEKSPVVVASNSILYDLARNVAGGRVEMKVLVGANYDPHTFEPTPQDNILLKNAGLVLENGLYLEPWMDKLYAASGSTAPRVCVTEGIELIEIKDEHVNHDGHGLSDFDPHVWQDVSNIYVMVLAIRDALVRIDPSHAGEYQRNTDAYITQLKELDKWIVEQMAGIPEGNRKLVTSHDTFGYFAKRYGLEVIGAVVDSATTEAADPSAEKMVRLVEKIKKAKVPAIFIENVTNPQMVRAVADEAGVKIAPALYSDALGEKGSPAENYIDMMRYNVQTMAEALK